MLSGRPGATSGQVNGTLPDVIVAPGLAPAAARACAEKADPLPSRFPAAGSLSLASPTLLKAELSESLSGAGGTGTGLVEGRGPGDGAGPAGGAGPAEGAGPDGGWPGHAAAGGCVRCEGVAGGSLSAVGVAPGPACFALTPPLPRAGAGPAAGLSALDARNAKITARMPPSVVRNAARPARRRRR